LEQIAEVNCEQNQAIICLVGEDIHGKPGIAASVFNTVAKAGVNVRMISQGASEINISFVISEADVRKAVRHVHEHFFPETMNRRAAARANVNGRSGRVRTKT
jgi:aspartate kinase